MNARSHPIPLTETQHVPVHSLGVPGVLARWPPLGPPGLPGRGGDRLPHPGGP